MEYRASSRSVFLQTCTHWMACFLDRPVAAAAMQCARNIFQGHRVENIQAASLPSMTGIAKACRQTPLAIACWCIFKGPSHKKGYLIRSCRSALLDALANSSGCCHVSAAQDPIESVQLRLLHPGWKVIPCNAQALVQRSLQPAVQQVVVLSVGLGPEIRQLHCSRQLSCLLD